LSVPVVLSFSTCLSIVRLLSHVLHAAVSLYLVSGFQLNLAHVFFSAADFND